MQDNMAGNMMTKRKRLVCDNTMPVFGVSENFEGVEEWLQLQKSG